MKYPILIGIVLATGTRAWAQSGPVVQVSELTSTQTGQRLILTARVGRVESAGAYEWRYTLRNPEANSVHVAAFTAAPRTDLTDAVIATTPEGWTAAKDVPGEGKVVWQWAPSPVGSPANVAQQLDPGESFVFSFMLNRAARAGGGVASAKNGFGFSGPTVSVAPLDQEFDFEVTQARPVSFLAPPLGVQLPAGVVWSGNCFSGDARTGGVATTRPACRFVGAVLCFDPGPDGSFSSFTLGGPANTHPRVRSVRLSKREPRVEGAARIWPGRTLTQDDSRGIRTYFPLRFTPAGTVISLEVEFDIISPGPPERVTAVQVNRFNYRVVVRPETLEWVVDALHAEPLGLYEAPCITDEGVYQSLMSQARALPAVAVDRDKTRAAIDTLEATLVRSCFTRSQLFEVDANGALVPRPLFRGATPGNSTSREYGFGIVDTVENPCCSMLLSDLAYLRRRSLGE